MTCEPSTQTKEAQRGTRRSAGMRSVTRLQANHPNIPHFLKNASQFCNRLAHPRASRNNTPPTS